MRLATLWMIARRALLCFAREGANGAVAVQGRGAACGPALCSRPPFAAAGALIFNVVHARHRCSALRSLSEGSDQPAFTPPIARARSDDMSALGGSEGGQMRALGGEPAEAREAPGQNVLPPRPEPGPSGEPSPARVAYPLSLCSPSVSCITLPNSGTHRFNLPPGRRTTRPRGYPGRDARRFCRQSQPVRGVHSAAMDRSHFARALRGFRDSQEHADCQGAADRALSGVRLRQHGQPRGACAVGCGVMWRVVVCVDDGAM